MHTGPDSAVPEALCTQGETHDARSDVEGEVDFGPTVKLAVSIARVAVALVVGMYADTYVPA